MKNRFEIPEENMEQVIGGLSIATNANTTIQFICPDPKCPGHNKTITLDKKRNNCSFCAKPLISIMHS